MTASFPAARPRRLRRTPALRALVAETSLRPRELVLPVFIKEGLSEPQPIGSMPGVVQHTRDSLRKAAAHLVAPSGMMDGQVAATRAALDAAGHGDVGICAYSAKYASGFYGPFREAAEGAPAFGDRASHQQDPANAAEALREVALDIGEGADMVMVKPALAYLDVIRRVADSVTVPVAAYQVSGEFAMVEAAAANGWLDRDRIISETLTAIRRAGASVILTYWAAEVARRLG